MTMTISIPRLLELAEKATPGPWHSGRQMRDEFDCPFYSVGEEDLSGRENKPHHYEDAICDVYGTSHDGGSNAAYIASCSPETILALCNAVKAAIPALEHIANNWMTDGDEKALKLVADALEHMSPFGRV